MFHTIKTLYDEKCDSIEKVNEKIENHFKIFIPQSLKAFHDQYNITSLDYNNDSNILRLQLKERQNNVDQGKKFNPGKKFRADEVPVFDLIKSLKKGRYKKLSLKQICDIKAEELLNISDYYKLKLFYRRFLNYNKKE